jgi:hypothetical protein
MSASVPITVSTDPMDLLLESTCNMRDKYMKYKFRMMSHHEWNRIR